MFWVLIGKKLNGEASPEELLELEELLQKEGAERYRFPLLEEIWNNRHQKRSDQKLEDKWNKFETKINIAEENENFQTAGTTEIQNNGSRSRIFKLIKNIFLDCCCQFAFGVLFVKKRTHNLQSRC